MFQAWPKIPRWENEKFYFTEKIDGTNACVIIQVKTADNKLPVPIPLVETEDCYIWAQSRPRFITPDDDNFGFARWVKDNAGELSKLGEGYHYGEWWGLGIQRGYNQTEKKFSLFNTKRWGAHNPNTPACASVVPTIHANTLEDAKKLLIEQGSLAAPGYMNVEGVVMYLYSTGSFYKEIINK